MLPGRLHGFWSAATASANAPLASIIVPLVLWSVATAMRLLQGLHTRRSACLESDNFNTQGKLEILLLGEDSV